MRAARVPAVLGVDGCKAGWVGARWRTDGVVDVLVAPAIGDLVATAGAPVVVGVDIPIGLPDGGRRAADLEARRLLPGKRSSVFPTLVRAAYEAPTYADGRAAMLAATAEEPGGPRSCSSQAWHLGRKVLEVDAWVRSGDPAVRVVEVHPEVSFAALAGAPLLPSKRADEGAAARRAALLAAGIRAPSVAPRGSAIDDVLDACAVAWTSRRVATGAAECLPDPPECFTDGWPAAIYV